MKQGPYRSLHENYDRTGVSCCLPQDVHDVRALCEVYRVPKRRINERIFLATLETKKERKNFPNANKLPCYFEAYGVVLRETWHSTAS